MQSGDPVSATLKYDGTTLSEIVIGTVTHARFTRNYAANIRAAIGDTRPLLIQMGQGAAHFQGNLDAWTYIVESPAHTY